MRIGELSARTGASTRSIRYYEEQGLLVSVRTATGQRTYAEAAVDRVVLIRRLSTRESAAADPSIRTPWLTDRLRDERERIVGEIEQLTQTVVAALDAVIGDLTSQGASLP